MGLTYGHAHILYEPHQVQILWYRNLWVENLILYFVLCQQRSKNKLLLNIDDQNTTYVLTPKGIYVAYLIYNLQEHQGIQPI